MYVSERRPPFNDPRILKAFSLSVDRDAFDRTFAAGKGGWVSAEYLIRGADTDTAEVELLQSQLAKGEINLTIKNVDKATGSSRLHNGDFDIAKGGHGVSGDQDLEFSQY